MNVCLCFISILFVTHHIHHTRILHTKTKHKNTVRAMDKSGRGHLTNEKVYSLMQEQLKMQKSLFQMKKVIVG